MLQYKCETVVLFSGVCCGFCFWEGMQFVCLYVCFTVRALICICNSIFVQSGEVFIVLTAQYSPVMYAMTWPREVTQHTESAVHQDIRHCIFAVSPFPARHQNHTYPIDIFFLLPKVHQSTRGLSSTKKMLVKKKNSSHASVVYSIDFLLFYLL